MEQFEVECLVIGAGVVGLAVARALAMEGKEVWLIEQESQIGMQTSSRNSEVIHAGIYYPKGSLKAKLCVKGRQMLYDYCDQNKIPYRRCGKLIVAKDESQIEKLESIQQHAMANGVDDLSFIDKAAVQKLEPDLDVAGALFSPSTGILDSHTYMQQLQADFERFGGQVVLNTKLSPLQIDKTGISFELLGQAAQVKARCCVNAAGLYAIDLFKDMPSFPQVHLPKASFAKGSYFSYSTKTPFSHLIYPVPESGGLGVHLTIDMAGAAKFGPDVEWLTTDTNPDDFNYSVAPEKSSNFAAAIGQYWPDVDESKLLTDYSGMRPKVSGPNEAAGDFIIQDESIHGVERLVNLFGIESPGLTSSLAIADEVCARLAFK